MFHLMDYLNTDPLKIALFNRIPIEYYNTKDFRSQMKAYAKINGIGYIRRYRGPRLTGGRWSTRKADAVSVDIYEYPSRMEEPESLLPKITEIEAI